MSEITLGNLNSDLVSYNNLVEVYRVHKNDFLENINVNITANFIAADIMAPLGGLLDILSNELNTIKISVHNPRVKAILQKNEFLSYYGYSTEIDWNNTVLPFRKFQKTDGKVFAEYINNWLIKGGHMPTLSDKLKLEILNGIMEVFTNSTIHSSTEFVYVCGQFYPYKKLIALTIADTGQGIRKTVNNVLQNDISSIDAIKWALQSKNSTKIDIPGGLGFDIVKRFIMANKGTLHVISDDGFYENGENGEIFKNLCAEYPGTVVSLQFRTDDKHRYKLKNE